VANPIFPSLIGLEWGMTRKQLWSTIVQEAASGYPVRIGVYPFARYQWTLSFSMLDATSTDETGLAADFVTLFGFLNSLYGRTLAFLYKDEYDNAVTNQPIATGDGTTTIFQLQRSLGGSIDPVFAPIASGMIVTLGGTPTVAYTVDITSGLITFASAPGGGVAIAASFSYYWRCFLDDDEGQEFGYFDKNGVEMKKLSFTSSRA
jgi:uncharacterized protein (TIGR02217 family)